MSLAPQADAARLGVAAGGGRPVSFTTISVSDGLSMNHKGMRLSLVSREIIADFIEAVMRACSRLRSAHDCRPRRALLHLSYSCAPPYGRAMLVTQDPTRHRLAACAQQPSQMRRIGVLEAGFS